MPKKTPKEPKIFTTPSIIGKESHPVSIIVPSSFQNNHEAMLHHIPFSYLCVKTSRACTFDDQIIFKDLARIQCQTIPNKR